MAVLWLVVGLVVGLGVGFWVGRKDREVVSSVVVPEPVKVPAKVEPQVWVRLVSGSGKRVLGGMMIPARSRRPQLVARGWDGLLSQFVASERDEGVWVYRRVGVLREQ